MRREEYIISVAVARKRLELALEEEREFEKVYGRMTNSGLLDLKRKRIELAIKTAQRLLGEAEKNRGDHG
jgi:hypothetical protein